MKQMIMMMTTTESHDDDGRRKRGWRTKREGCALYSFLVLCMIPGKMILRKKKKNPASLSLSFTVFFSPSSCSSWCLMQEERWGKKWRRGSSSNREKKGDRRLFSLFHHLESWLEAGREHHQDKCHRISDDGDGKRRRTREEERRGGRIERVQSKEEEHLWQGVVRSLSLDHSFPSNNTHSSLPSSSSFSFSILFYSLPVFILWIFHVMRKRKRKRRRRRREKNRKSSLESEKKKWDRMLHKTLDQTSRVSSTSFSSLPPLLPLFFFPLLFTTAFEKRLPLGFTCFPLSSSSSSLRLTENERERRDTNGSRDTRKESYSDKDEWTEGRWWEKREKNQEHLPPEEDPQMKSDTRTGWRGNECIVIARSRGSCCCSEKWLLLSLSLSLLLVSSQVRSG